jgi:hypothetical protein
VGRLGYRLPASGGVKEEKVNRERAIETARAVLDSSYSRADAVSLALYVLGKDIEGVFSPSAPSCGGGESPATPDSAPVSTESLAVSPARNLGSLSGNTFPKEADTQQDIGRTETNAATIPTVYPTTGMSWQDEKIATWMESHAMGYEHGGFHDIAQALRKKAMQIRRREYLEDKA